MEDLQAVSSGNNNAKYASKVNCRKKNCGHTVIFSCHFLSDEWEAVVEALSLSAGVCEYCSEDVKKIRGKTEIESKLYHMFNKCTVYPYSHIVKSRK